jgi:hypothetical protein
MLKEMAQMDGNVVNRYESETCLDFHYIYFSMHFTFDVAYENCYVLARCQNGE